MKKKKRKKTDCRSARQARAVCRRCCLCRASDGFVLVFVVFVKEVLVVESKNLIGITQLAGTGLDWVGQTRGADGTCNHAVYKPL